MGLNPKRIANQNDDVVQEAVWSAIRYLDPDDQANDSEAKCVAAIVAILVLLVAICVVGFELWLRVSGS